SRLEFHIYPVERGKTSQNSVFTGKVTLQKELGTSPDNAQPEILPEGSFVGANVWQCDFSDFAQTGEYVISVENMGISFPFRIDPDAYYDPFFYVTRALYYERALTALEEPYALRWPRPEWENRKLVYTKIRTLDLTDESGKNQKQKIFDNFDRSVDLTHIHGWYHDAGDWDGYFSHFRVPRSLLIAYELTPESFRDGELNIPEAQKDNGYAGTHIPDLLDEAVWLVDYFKNNVGPTGGIFGSRIEPDISDQSCKPEGTPSWLDCTEWIVFGEDPRDSYAFASIASEYAYCLGLAQKQTGEDYSAIMEDYRKAAINAWNWANHNTRPGDEEKRLFIENRMAANAWLYKLTGDTEFENHFEKDVKRKGIDAKTEDLGETKWAVWAYVTTPEVGNKKLQKNLITATKNFADYSVTNAIDQNRSMRMGGRMKVPLNNGQATTPLVIPAMVAWDVCKATNDPDARKYYDACVTTTSYFLGSNPLNMVWMSGVGHNHPRYVFHLDSWFDQIDDFIPGIVPYGPRVLCDWFAAGPDNDRCDYNGPHDADFSLLDGRLYPAYFNDKHEAQWPAHELWVENYRSVPADEYTVHQTIAPAAAAYGFLTAKNGTSEMNQYPFVMIQTPEDEYQAGNDVSFDLRTADDEWIYSVKFYANNHFIGSAKPDSQTFIWHDVPKGDYTVRTVAEDNVGLRSTSVAVHFIVR
ncbi:MAG TPA: glycoside hydrolase family 9 protein, partial [Bacteroidales bacterium]|nr:glycoside hydrolase family 9 protein [Bacteroidales bacterium]